jgi:hypothetical protein
MKLRFQLVYLVDSMLDPDLKMNSFTLLLFISLISISYCFIYEDSIFVDSVTKEHNKGELYYISPHIEYVYYCEIAEVYILIQNHRFDLLRQAIKISIDVTDRFHLHLIEYEFGNSELKIMDHYRRMDKVPELIYHLDRLQEIYERTNNIDSDAKLEFVRILHEFLGIGMLRNDEPDLEYVISVCIVNL